MKKVLNTLIVVFFFGLLSQACDKEEDTGLINLNLGETYQASGLTLKFASVISDSRCPSNVICVWGGNAEVLFDFEKVGINTDFKLDTASGNNFKNDTLIGGYRIKLLKVLPYPESEGEIEPDDYSIEIEISRE